VYVQDASYSDLLNVVASCDSAGYVVASRWPRINTKVIDLFRVVLIQLSFSSFIFACSCNLLPCSRGTVVSNVFVDACAVALKPVHGKLVDYYSQYCAVTFFCNHKCHMSYMCPGHDVKLHQHRVHLYPLKVFGIWLGLCEGANIIISK